jgi:hypothetical protein
VAERDISSGPWTAHQSNNHDVRFNLDQDENGKLSGTADAIPLGDDPGDPFSGTVIDFSSVQENRVQIVVDWSQGSRGKYIGAFDFSGRLSGNTFDINNPGAQALWFSEETF